MGFAEHLSIIKAKAEVVLGFTAVKVVFLWLTWLICGAAFYATNTNFGWRKGLFMAVNVGYSIGWGYPVEQNDNQIWFSIMFVLLGSSAVAAALGYFAQYMIMKDKNWFEAEQERKAYDAAMKGSNQVEKIKLSLKLHRNKIIPVAVWLVWVTWGAIWAREYVGWSIPQTIYFAISSLSTGGLWGLPVGSEDNAYLTTAVFAMIGVPLAAFAMAEVGSAIVSGAHSDDTMEVINAPVTLEELRKMAEFGLENGDGNVDKAEFIVLCMVRLGAADPALITAIGKRFSELDSSQDGTLSYKEICGKRDSMVCADLDEYLQEIRQADKNRRPSRRASAVNENGRNLELSEIKAPFRSDDASV